MDLGLKGKTAVITGGGGAICGAIAHGLAREGAKVAVWDLSAPAAAARAAAIEKDGGTAAAMACDAGDTASVKHALEETLAAFGTVDILVNGAGGSRPEATTSPALDFFSIGRDAMQSVLGLNYLTAVVPCQEVGRVFRDNGQGVIVNIASIAGMRPLTRSVAYSSGKAALINFTQWLAVHMATEYSPRIRVNAVAPGFLLSEQNRFLLVNRETGAMTARGDSILGHVPLKRLATTDDMTGPVLWLVSEQAAFVTGAVIPVDGGFTAYAGV
jgi:NAD(P)-dependent dehydrogenase (short-subunit alcohol dehydrogenase family)